MANEFQEGIFVAYYTGRYGMGVGLFVISGGKITGADAAGGRYRGQYRVDAQNECLKGNVKLTAAEGMTLVTGQTAPAGGIVIEFPITIPFRYAEAPVLMTLPTGSVNVKFDYLGDI